MRKSVCIIMIMMILISLLSCSNNKADHQGRDWNAIWEFQEAVYNLSPEIRAVEVKGDASYIDVYVYSQYLDIEEGELNAKVEDIAIEHELSDKGDYRINILDISMAPERMG